MNWIYSIGVVILGLSSTIGILMGLQYLYVFGPKWLMRENSEPSVFLMFSGLLTIIAVIGLTIAGILEIVHK